MSFPLRARTWIRQLAVMTGKEFRQLFRDRVLLFFVLYIFTANILLAAGENTGELHRAAVLVHDSDHSAASRELIYRFRMPYFRFAGEVSNVEEGLRALDRGQAVLLIDIPERFHETLREGRSQAQVQVLVNSTKATRGYLASSYGGRIAAEFAADWLRENGHAASVEAQRPAIRNNLRVWHNPELREPWFRTLAELLGMMTLACILLPASAMVREKERGTIEQLLVSPLSPLQVLLSKVLAMLVVSLAGTALALFGIMQPLYQVPARGSLPLFFLLTALYAFTNAGLGLLAATFARNAAQVGMLVLLMVMPILLLSGTYTPLESMPEALRWAMQLSPLRHFVDIAYGILLRGADARSLALPALWMTVLGTLLFLVGLRRFRSQFQ